MMATFCERWDGVTTVGYKIVDLHEYEQGWYGVVKGRFATFIVTWFKNGAAGNHTLGNLVPLPKPKVPRRFRDLAEFAAAVYAVMPADMGGSPPGMCLAFVWWRDKGGKWISLDSLQIDFVYRFEAKKEWTIDPLDPVGRPFGVEE